MNKISKKRFYAQNDSHASVKAYEDGKLLESII